MRIVIHGKEGADSLDVTGSDYRLRVGQGVVEVLCFDASGSIVIRGWPQSMVYHYEVYVDGNEHGRAGYL